MSRTATAQIELKRLLAEEGHIDWVTYHEGYPFDIFFHDHRVAIRVFGCLSHGCPEHGKWKTEEWEEAVRTNLSTYEKAARGLQDLHWRTIYCYECDILQRGKKTVGKILSVLESQRSRVNAATSQHGPRSDRGMARLIAMDMASRIGRPAWTRFLEVIRDVSAGSRVQKIKKRDVRVALVSNETWDPAAFDAAWQGARWHHVIRLGQGWGCASRGELWRAVLEEADVPLA